MISNIYKKPRSFRGRKNIWVNILNDAEHVVENKEIEEPRTKKVAKNNKNTENIDNDAQLE